MTKKIGPHRQCIGCRGVFPKGELLRFVHDASGCALFDETQSLNRRGFYLCPERVCLASACRNKRGRSLLRDEKAASGLVPSLLDSLLGSVERVLAGSENTMPRDLASDSGENLREGDVLLIRDDIPGQSGGTLTEAGKARGASVFTVPPTVLHGSECRVIKRNSPKISPILRNLRFYERLSFKGREL